MNRILETVILAVRGILLTHILRMVNIWYVLQVPMKMLVRKNFVKPFKSRLVVQIDQYPFYTSLEGDCYKFTPQISGGIPESYLWEATDGSTSSSDCPVFDFNEYAVMVSTVVFQNGCTISYSPGLLFQPCCMNKDVDMEITGNCIKSYQSVGEGMGAINWLWDLGDGMTVNSEAFTYEHEEPGNSAIFYIYTDLRSSINFDLTQPLS